MADQNQRGLVTPPRVPRAPAVAPPAPIAPVRPAPVMVPGRRLNFNNAPPRQMNPGGTPGRRKGGRRTRGRKSRKTYTKKSKK